MLMFMSDLAHVELRHLVALCAVAEQGSIARAAGSLGFTQSAVSQQIAGLERAVGSPVVDRPGGPRPVELTPAGRLLVGHARAVLDRLALAGRELDELAAGRSGRLAVGTFQSVLVRLLPRLVGELVAETPDVELSVVEADWPELLERVLSGELDVVFVIAGETDERFETVPVLEDPYLLLQPPSWPHDSGPVPIGELAGVPLLGQAVEDSCQRLIETGLREAGVIPRYVLRTDDNGAVQAMVRAGLGAAVMPRLAADLDDPEVQVRELRPELPRRRIELAYRRGRTLSAAARRFVELARRVGAATASEVPVE